MVEPTPPILSVSSTDARLIFASRWSNGSVDLVAYICAFPGHFEFVGVPRSHTHTQERLQAIQILSDQIFSP